MTNQLVHISEAHLGHQHTHLLSHKHEVVHHMLRHALELLSQHGVLCGNANRTGVEMALPHHDATHGNQRRRGKAEALGSQKCRDHHVPTCAELTIRLQSHTPTEAVEHQGLMRLCQTNFPRGPCMLDASPLGCTSPTVAAADQNVVCLALGHSSCDYPNPDLTHQLHADACVRVGVLQVEDQLGQILDGVDVVMGRRGDEADSRSGVAGLGNASLHFLARKLPSLTRLGSLGHLDLKLLRIGKVLHGDSETPRSHLLDGGLEGVPVGQRLVPGWILTALPSVREATKPVHGDGQGAVCFHGDGAVGHGTRPEALHDLAGRLHCFEGQRRAAVLPGRLEIQLTTDGRGFHQVVVEGCKGGICCAGVGSCRLLKLGNDHGIVQVLLGVGSLAVVVLALVRQGGEQALHSVLTTSREATVVDGQCPQGNLLEAQTAQLTCNAGKTHFCHILAQANCIRNLSSFVAPQG
mmetsp:Transcript_33722/g.75712  ORF Transcript_33722/g.75712 Transcript_33722/m.75712 type:complete len:466 (+) Transcript_33722:2942-4339(+)